MVGRARRGAEGKDFFLQERDHAVVGEDRRRRLIEKSLVRRAAALGDKQELVGVLALGKNVDLGGQIVAGVLFLEHRQRRDLAVAQVLFDIRRANTRRERRFVAARGVDEPPLLRHHDRGAGVLAHRQHPARGDVGVLEQVIGDELVVRRRLGVVEDFLELGEMAGPEQVVDVDERLFGDEASAPPVRRR